MCWCNQCCCCDFLHNSLNKSLAWWICITLFLGILACCISAFVTINRFGFALEGVWCGITRIYYDSLNGQLKLNTPRWEGFANTSDILGELNKFIKSLSDEDNLNTFVNDFVMIEKKWVMKLYNNIIYIPKTIQDKLEMNNEDYFISIRDKIQVLSSLSKIINDINQIHNITNFYKENKIQFLPDYANEINENNFSKIQTKFIDKFEYYAKILRATFKILPMIYFCLLLIAVTCALVSMIFYVCLRRQGYLKVFMIVLWNIIRFFILSFFIYGTVFGIGHLGFQDTIGYIMYIFQDNLKTKDTKLVDDGKNFFRACLEGNDNNLKNKFNELGIKLLIPLQDFFSSYQELQTFSNINNDDLKDKINQIKTAFKNLCEEAEIDHTNLLERADKNGGIFASFDCGFLKSYLHQIYRAIYDASIESRILSALSLCAAFFGILGGYLFLLIIHHYNNELFYNSGNRIFTGLGGFRRGSHKENDKNIDPAYKKRKLKAEIESSLSKEVSAAKKDDKQNE